VPIRSVGEVIGRHPDVPAEDTAGRFGWLAGFIGTDSQASSTLTRELLGWQPARPGLLADQGPLLPGPGVLTPGPRVAGSCG
jgi:hypothetical protein